MTEPDLKTTLREFKQYVALSYESPGEIAARVGVAQRTIWCWLAGTYQPRGKSLAKLRRFLDAEAKTPLQGDGVRPVETIPYKIIRPIQKVRYARLCPFCRKARGKIRKLGATSFQVHARSAERPARSGKATMKPCELGMPGNRPTLEKPVPNKAEAGAKGYIDPVRIYCFFSKNAFVIAAVIGSGPEAGVCRVAFSSAGFGVMSHTQQLSLSWCGVPFTSSIFPSKYCKSSKE
jgi:hypothetical protein